MVLLTWNLVLTNTLVTRFRVISSRIERYFCFSFLSMHLRAFAFCGGRHSEQVKTLNTGLRQLNRYWSRELSSCVLDTFATGVSHIPIQHNNIHDMSQGHFRDIQSSVGFPSRGALHLRQTGERTKAIRFFHLSYWIYVHRCVACNESMVLRDKLG